MRSVAGRWGGISVGSSSHALVILQPMKILEKSHRCRNHYKPGPSYGAILARVADGNKKVQEFACSTLSIFFETCDEHGCSAAFRPPRLQPIFEHLLRCLGSYQVRSCRVMFDTIGTLCEAVERHGWLAQEPTLAQGLLSHLLQRWQATADNDILLCPLLDCLGQACAASKLNVQEVALPVAQRCCGMIESIMLADAANMMNPVTGEPYDKEIVASLLDIMDGLLRAIGGNFGVLLNTPGCVGGNGGTGGVDHFLQLLGNYCCRDSEEDVRRAALGLVGDLCDEAPLVLQTNAAAIARVVIESITLTDPSFRTCCSNAAWALSK